MRQGFFSTWTGAIVATLAGLTVFLGVVPHLPRFVERIAAAEEAAPADDQLPEAAPADQGAAVPETEARPQEKSVLRWFFESLGWTYTLAFLTISFSFVALLVMNLVSCRREAVMPSALIDGFETLFNEKKFQEAYELAKNDDSFLGQVLSAGLAKLSAGYSQAIEAMQEVGEEQAMRMEHRLSYIGLIGTISPMVGLLGTVDGMVRSFSVIANSTTTPKPSELARGISTALITTLVGLIIAIPAVIVYGFLRNRIARLVLEVGIVSEGLMSRFSTAAPRK
ncbi:MotA/TolQ/ExbB proton channel family protein [Thermogutta sp.]|uniref:MotA/TolQ/ExbB proton channel family protein n=1 Tax=Thermogutta sp. TaxID=1962930 RepID=UPI003C7C6EA2